MFAYSKTSCPEYSSGDMSDRCWLSDSSKSELEELRQRYKHRGRSDCDVLLDAMLHDANKELRKRAAFLYGLLRYRKGIRQIEKATRSYLKQFRNMNDPEEHPGFWCFDSLLYAIANMDYAKSHDLLTDIVRSEDNLLVKGRALYHMAWEEQMFDIDFVSLYITSDNDESTIYDAMYTLLYRNLLSNYPILVREHILPLLYHQHSGVRMYAVAILCKSRKYRDLVDQQLSHPDMDIRRSARDAMEMMLTPDQVNRRISTLSISAETP